MINWKKYEIFLFALIVFLTHITKSNLLRSPFFNYPIMPLDVVYYNFPVHEYMLTHWRFYFTGTYVCFNYPQPKAAGVPQVLFMDDDRQTTFQMFRVVATIEALKVTVYYRMPFSYINGTIRITIDSTFAINLTYRHTIRNQVLTASNLILNTNRTEKMLAIRAYGFTPIVDFNVNRTGYQILSVLVEPTTNEIYLEGKREKACKHIKMHRAKKNKNKKYSSSAGKPSTSTANEESTPIHSKNSISKNMQTTN